MEHRHLFWRVTKGRLSQGETIGSSHIPDTGAVAVTKKFHARGVLTRAARSSSQLAPKQSLCGADRQYKILSGLRIAPD